MFFFQWLPTPTPPPRPPKISTVEVKRIVIFSSIIFEIELN